MKYQPKAIETHYMGYRFRSRLEARWAVFMDVLRVKWEYEPEGFDFGRAGRYLPDFYLPSQDIYLEIKPDLAFHWDWPESNAWNKAYKLSMQSGKKVVILCGTPGPGDDKIYSYQGFICGKDVMDNDYYWCECPSCGSIGIQYQGRSARNAHSNDCKIERNDKNYNPNSIRLVDAWELSRSARFENRSEMEALKTFIKGY